MKKVLLILIIIVFFIVPSVLYGFGIIKNDIYVILINGLGDIALVLVLIAFEPKNNKK